MLVLVFHLVVTLDRYHPERMRAWFEFGQIGVDLFFIISGFVMALSIQNMSGPTEAASFLSRRLFRIAPLLYVVTVIHLLLASAQGRMFDQAQVVNGFTILPAFETSARYDYALIPAWTLGFELAFYFLVALAVALPLRWRLSFLIGLLLVLPLAALPFPPALSPYNSFMMWEFALGVGAFGLWSRGVITTRRAALIAILALAMLVVPLHEARILKWGLPCGLLFTALLAWRPGRGYLTKVALWLGTISYSMYLCHVVVFDALAPLLVPLVGILLSAVILGGISIAVSWWLYSRVERPILHARFYSRAAFLR